MKVEPERLQDSIPKFKPWVSSTAWGHWEDFLKFDLANLSRSPGCDGSFCWPVLVLQAASDRRIQVTSVEECSHIDEGEILEEMLDEERVPVQVCMDMWL